MPDRGAKNLLIVFLMVCGALTLFYAFLAWRSLTWSPTFFVKNANSERSKVTLVSAMETAEVEQTANFFKTERAASLFNEEEPLANRQGYLLTGGYSSLVADDMLPRQNQDMKRPRREQGTKQLPSVIQHGKSLYLRSGCALCHGPDGRGGVKNQNYVKDAIPALNTLSEKMLIWEQADAEELISLLAANKPLASAEDLELPNAAAVVAQYISVRDVIEQGQVADKKDPSGSSPIDMPAWKGTLSRRDIDSIIAYLLNLYPWEEEE